MSSLTGPSISKVMVIAGTSDAREVIYELLRANIQVVATVATEFGSDLLKDDHGLEVHQGRMNKDQMIDFMTKSSVDMLIDASHPFAKEVSQNAILSSSEVGIPYLRFEREKTEAELTDVMKVNDFEEAAKKAVKMQGNILLTIGSNHLEVFIKEIEDFKERLFVRVLPDSKVMEKCEKLSLTADNIIAMKGPFSYEMNMAILKYCKASVMVTKESGDAGGTIEKLKAAKDLGISVILVERPQVEYVNKVSKIGDVMEFVSVFK